MGSIIKYPLLQSKEWLHQKYIVEKLSTVKISKIVGCGAGVVVGALNRRGIKTRSIKQTVYKGHKGFSSNLLNDPLWLKAKYWDEKLTSYDIAKQAGTNQHSVMCALNYHKINRRSFSNAAKNRKYFWRKYNILEDKSWLHEQYIIAKKSSVDLSKEIGTTPQNVLRALHKFGISVRTNSEAQSLIERSSKFEILNNIDLLDTLYNKRKLSTISIAKIAGAKSCNSVRQFLLKSNLIVRNYREAQVHSREDDAFICNKAVIDGGLLGDASVRAHNNDSDTSAPYYCRKNKHYEHILWVSKQLIGNGPEMYIGTDTTYLNGKKFIYPTLRTQSHDCLTPFLKRWYPKSNPYSKKYYEKIIPEDIDISPLSLLHAFLDDGSTYQRKREKEGSFKKQVVTTLSIQGFPKEYIEMLCEKIKKEYGSSFYIHPRKCPSGYGYLIEISQGSYNRFMEIIGPCPPELVSVMGYKWK